MKTKCLAVGIILLFVGVIIAPALAQNTEKQSVSIGNWLYVGGSGPGNYTRIQDAIDNASDGDTVFVYDDSSPYIEWLTITHSITLIGELRNTTIIKGSTRGLYLIHIIAPYVSVRGFSLLNNHGSGIYIESHNVTITDTIISGTRSYGIKCQNANDTNISYNIIRSSGAGISMYSGDVTYGNINRNIIAHNVIRYSARYQGIHIWGDHNVIHNNNIAPADSTIDGTDELSIELGGQYNNVSYNTISSLKTGLSVDHSYKNIIYRNNFINNHQFGLVAVGGSGDRILENNFMYNAKNAKIFTPIFTTKLMRNFYHYPSQLLPTLWERNFWDRPRLTPYPIFSFLMFDSFLIGYWSWFFPESFENYFWKLVNFVRFDWHPAQEPYDIPGGWKNGYETFD